MNVFKRFIPTFVLQFLLRKIASKRGNVKFKKGVLINGQSVFEGNNTIYNNTEVSSSFIGQGTYIARESIIRNAKIGRFCAIGENVRTSLGLHPAANFTSTHPAFFSLMKQAGFTFVEKQLFEEHKFVDPEGQFFCEIGNDVWIGNNVMIMDGIKIGDGAIVAAGSIVTKDVAPYAIVGGVPAKKIRWRFDEDEIQALMRIEWWNWDFETLKNRSSDFISVKTFISSQVVNDN